MTMSRKRKSFDLSQPNFSDFIKNADKITAADYNRIPDYHGPKNETFNLNSNADNHIWTCLGKRKRTDEAL